MAFLSVEVINVAVNQVNPAAVNATIPVGCNNVIMTGGVYEGAGNGIASQTLGGNNPTRSFEDTTSGDGFPFAAQWVGADFPGTGTRALDLAFDDNPNNGPNVCLWYFDNDDDWRDADGDAPGGSTNATATLTSTATDFFCGMDDHYDTTAAANPAGWTSRATQDNRDGMSARFRSLDAPGATTSTIDSEDDYYSIVCGVTVPIPSSGISATIGQVTETDTSQALTSAKALEIGQNTETDAAQAMTPAKAQEIGQVTETDQAQAMTVQTSGGNQTVAIGQVTETDIAQAMGRDKAPNMGLVSHTDLAQPMTVVTGQGINQVTETDQAQPMTSAKTQSINQVAETDTAQPMAANQGNTVNINQVEESDTAQPMTSAKTQSIGPVTETDAAQPMTAARLIEIGQVTETDAAQPMTFESSATLSIATETDQAQPMTVIGGTAPVAEKTGGGPGSQMRRQPKRTPRVILPPSPGLDSGNEAAIMAAVDVYFLDD